MGHDGNRFAVAFRRQLRLASTRLMGSQHVLASRIDVGSVHELRVAARQARALLWSAKPWLIRRRHESCLTHLKWLSSGLGPLRDIDVTARLLREPIARHAQLNSAQRTAPHSRHEHCLRKARASEFHKLRIRAKQCRYALEALGEQAPAAVVLKLRRMQRVLGRYVDLQFAAAWCDTRATGELDHKLRRRIRRSARSLARRQARAVCPARNP